MACNVAFCLQREPLRGGVVIDLDAEGDRWREEADGWRGRRERRGQRGDGQQAASQLAPTEGELSDRHLGVTGGGMSGHLAPYTEKIVEVSKNVSLLYLLRIPTYGKRLRAP